jgi:hypothetical protein
VTGLTATIAALDDVTAVRVLADTADYQTQLPDPAQLRTMETGLREALTTDPTLTGYNEAGASADAGELARATLQHLATSRPDLASVITRAIEDPAHQTRDPVTLTVAALVVIALQTEVKLTRNSQGRWTFTVHKHPMRDSALGQVIAKLLGYFTGGQ